MRSKKTPLAFLLFVVGSFLMCSSLLFAGTVSGR